MKNMLLPLVAALALTSMSSPVFAARFTGGMCVSQGNWLQAALQQSDVITGAINALKDDPNCKVLVDALQNSPKYEPGQVDDPETSSFANLNKELQALSSFIKGGETRAANAQGWTLKKDAFQDIVFHTTFNKTYSAIRELQNSGEFAKMNTAQLAELKSISLRLKAFLSKSKAVANMSMKSAQGILAALPQSQLCLDKRPSTAAAIFGAIAQTATSLTTGGEVGGVGEFIGSLLNYSRQMHYVKALQPMELERFRNSVSCLVESTSEAYCTIEDAEETLNFFKEINLSAQQKKVLEQVMVNENKDSVASTLSGLVLLTRDVPVLQAWMQKVLFGIDPKLSAEATMKNDNWKSYISFIMSINSLMADFNDKEALYNVQTKGKSIQTKLGQVKDILDTVLSTMNSTTGGINFFQRALQDIRIPFYLLKVQFPSDFNAQTKNFETFFAEWDSQKTNGLADPDQLLKTIRSQLWDMMEQATIQANEFFANRMIVDAQNLVTEAMKGPGVSPYQALNNLKNYYENLIVKLEAGAKDLATNPLNTTRVRAQRAQIPLIKNSINRIDKIIKALDSATDVNDDSELSASVQSQGIMNTIYETANMMVSRDSLFGTRMATILQADISDTLYRNRDLNKEQREFFMYVGPQIVSKLSGYFTINPVNQRADISAAKVIHIENLKSVEKIFAKTLFAQIASITCQIEGGYTCQIKGDNYDPANELQMRNVNEFIARQRENKGLLFKMYKWMNKPTEDSQAHKQVRAKLCIQALAFESRNAFAELCRDSVLVSDFADVDKEDTFKLNMNFTTELNRVKSITNTGGLGSMDKSRTAGVCSLRSYLRKNQVFFMYREYMDNK